ncbi:hypothetical protein NCCP2222_02170 [Sporosarcina sp. NCCP-2222]|uniref:hypothetical protein n=1 Tax=Sporosarcina sp. NCCP-2222 TaxID=2935073 RepID=UPI002082FB3F|nr:hypothetical protein [Sporosarcina sp. NCCP-2222]GKV54270.1 hypothetical protein NCCP2222_02170 [Sporosarcina sp. NCCP-2222]
MAKSFQWEIRSMGEENPYTVYTAKDDVLAAVTQFVEQYPTVSVYSVRKSAEIIHYEEAI